jgi:hypothetical protein
MAGVKLVVISPRPKDIEVFEKLYQEEHVAMAVDKLAGKTKFIATKVVATPDGTPPRSTESPRSISRPWRHCKHVRSPPVETIAHAVKISSGAPRFSWSPKSKRSCLGAAKSARGSLLADFLWLWRRRLLCEVVCRHFLLETRSTERHAGA